MAASMAVDSQCVLPFPSLQYCKIEASPCQTCLCMPVPTNKDWRHGCDTRFWKVTYIWGIISWQARWLLPVGARWLTGEQNECNALSDTDTHHHYCDRYQARELFWNLYWVLFTPHTTANERTYVFVSPITLTRHEDAGRERVNLDDWHSFSAFQCAALCRPPGCLEVQDIPLMVVSLPARTHDFGGPPWSHSQRDHS